MRYFFSIFGCVGIALATSSPAQQKSSVHEQLTTLAEQIVYRWAERHPMTATDQGIGGYDGQLETPTEGYRAADLKLTRDWLKQLRAAIPPNETNISLVDRNDAKLLQARLAQMLNSLTVYNTDRKDYGGTAQAIVNAIFTQFKRLPISGQNGATEAEVQKAWGDIIARLSKASAYIAAGQKLVTRPGHLFGEIALQQLAGAPEFFNGPLTETAMAQLSTDAFSQFIKARDATLSAIARTRNYISGHLASWPENFAIGRKAYNAMLHDEQLLPFTSADVERMGGDGLAHGWAEEAWLASLVQLRGTPFGPQTGGGLAPGGPVLIDYYRDRIADLRKFMVDQDVITIPEWLGSVEVLETPSFLQPIMPGASMTSPRLFAKETTGFFFITPPKSLEDAAKRLDMNQDFDRDRILSTAAHEVMPGHFMQLSIAKRHPNFIRKIQVSLPFAEGWCFYGEEMLVRLGLYGDNLDARLYTARWERVRGARATVDSKLAAGEWTHRQAADWFAKQTEFTQSDADAQVASIALAPGWAIAYMVGRLQLEDLLAEYMLRVGNRGSLRDFHDRLLSYGTTPFAIVAPELLADLDKPASAVRSAANY